jgi:hypothetical protein
MRSAQDSTQVANRTTEVRRREERTTGNYHLFETGDAQVHLQL